MTAEMDVLNLRELKWRVESLLTYFVDTVGEEHAFVALLETRLAGLRHALRASR